MLNTVLATTTRSNALYVRTCDKLFRTWAKNAERSPAVAVKARRALKCLHIEGSADQATTQEFATHALRLGGIQ